MSSSIGGKSFISLHGGTLAPMGAGSEIITRDGVDGVAIRSAALAPAPVEMLSSADVDDQAAATTLIADYKALKGTLVTVVEDSGQSTSNVLVFDVVPQQPVPIVGAGGGLRSTPTFLVKAVWQLLPTTVPS